MSRKIKSVIKFVSSKLLNRPVPFFVNFRLTDKCNLKCKYCDVPLHNQNELSTSNVLKIINFLHKSGTISIALNGGEPSLRKDIKIIIDYIKKKNIQVTLFTNSYNLEEKFNLIKNIDNLFISIDGEKTINDKLRGKNVYDDIIKTIKFANKEKINILTSTTINSQNINSIEHIFELSKEYNFKCIFQIVSQNTTYFVDENKIKKYIPNKNDLPKFISLLKKNKKHLAFSKNSIQNISKYPHNKIKCYAGRYMYNIEPNGDVTPCVSFNYSKHKKKNILDKNFKFEILKFYCNYCWSTVYFDFNLAFNFNKISLKNTLKLFKYKY